MDSRLSSKLMSVIEKMLYRERFLLQLWCLQNRHTIHWSTPSVISSCKTRHKNLISMCCYKKWKAVNINVYEMCFIYISRLGRPQVSLLSERGQLSWVKRATCLRNNRQRRHRLDNLPRIHTLAIRMLRSLFKVPLKQ